MHKSKAIEKIKKLKELSRSSNAHEAAAALRQMKKMMAMYDITEDELNKATASEFTVETSSSKKPSRWKQNLLILISAYLGVHVFTTTKDKKVHLHFIGANGAGEIAAYAYETLTRQISKARKQYTQTLHESTPRGEKIKLGNDFCFAFVDGLGHLIEKISPPKSVINYLTEHHPQIGHEYEKKTRSREKDIDAWVAGTKASKNAYLHHGVKEKPKEITHSRQGVDVNDS